MDALGKSLVALAVVLTVVACIVPLASEPSDGYGEADGLLLYEVNPWNNHEGVSVFNYGDAPVDLRDYTITDNPSITGGREGTITFSESIIVQPGSFVVLASTSGNDCNFINRDGVDVRYFGENGITADGFNLNNNGDDIYLWHNGTAIDAVCYGNVVIDDADLWQSYNSYSDTTNVFFQRMGTFDNDTEEDWFDYKPGLTNLEFNPDLKFEAEVTPFLFPDSGGIPVYMAFENAQESVYLNIYQLGSSNFYALLCQLEQRGVDVYLLMEGESLSSSGNYINTVASYIKDLIDCGGEVRLIGVGDDGVVDRYAYDHAKYAIIDGETVVITSENYTSANLNGKLDNDPYNGSEGNRGWGAIIKSADYAEYMQQVFDMDYSKAFGDVKDFTEIYPNVVAAGNLDYKGHDDAYFETYTAYVTPVLSSDNSYEALEYYISSATERVYTEQQSLGSTYTNLSPTSPVTLMNERAKLGVECIAVFDDADTGNADQVFYINSASEVSAALMVGTTLHNKGLVCDNISWVSSINWTSNSFHNNREACAVIESAEIADYFARCILNDFNQFYDYEGFSVDITEISQTYLAGQEVTLTVNVSPAGNYEYTWDLGDGSEPRTTDINRIVCTPIAEGDASAYTLTVTVKDLDTGMTRTVYRDYTVVTEDFMPGEGDDQEQNQEDSALPEFISDNLYILIPLIVIILAAIAAVSRSGKKKKRSTKKK